jgi:hypothetical protein
VRGEAPSESPADLLRLYEEGLVRVAPDSDDLSVLAQRRVRLGDGDHQRIPVVATIGRPPTP